MHIYNWYVDQEKSIGDIQIQETLFPYCNILHVQRLVAVARVSVHISAISSTVSVTDHKYVRLMCCDIFSSMFLILNNI